jgi:glycosyltransferase involved in cell wall biosynthesis
MYNNNLTVVTVTFNNAAGLDKTLNSLKHCYTKPKKIIIIDGGSNDLTSKIVTQYKKNLPILFISESDRGIYDAMNKAKSIVKTPLVHYLNAGDIIVGDPYLNSDRVGILVVNIHDPGSKRNWKDFIKLSGYGYCHQGIILPSNHLDYNIKFNISADFDLFCKIFPEGLNGLPVFQGGYVIYELGGVSSEYSSVADFEILSSAKMNLPYLKYLQVYSLLGFKKLIPKFFRRYGAYFLR